MSTHICCFLQRNMEILFLNNRQISTLATSENNTYEPRHEKICHRAVQPGNTQTGLLSYRS